MAYTLGNKCAKNLCKRIVLLQLIIENVVTCFFLEHVVLVLSILQSSDATQTIAFGISGHYFESYYIMPYIPA